ncbi:phosphate-starvation-inducible PsiE family protein [Acinetobacter baumannii]|uniref:phosphate-starvation-inducible PsiE family protein n=3 Tax=Acinetobacter calcoaceticus/baumannii complex TaxID=909768 RepID=UPI003EBBAA22
MKEKQLDPIKTFRAQWAVMTFYERFEQVIALALSAIIALIIVVSLLQLISIVFSLLVIDAFNPLDHKVFQTVFGMIMTLLIAMEFKHSIVRVALRRDSIIQVKTVILIGLIALARKFVILDPETSPAKIAALAGAMLALGATYWLVRSLTLRELTGVLGHEIAHIANEDLRVMGLADSISPLTHLLALLGQIMLLFSLPALLWGTVAIQWPALLLLAVSPQLALLAQLGLSRVREFDARAHPTLAGIG